ncbi:hypothetical protein AaE_008892 [Aphanomyces astaci]|uniref:Uncharacterized protein n=1 Tax=Aphanomyces astaci TaxID=112090 RepID=A0A6A4ZYQ3_APHAT|nr:hypothetical protein AaE_008892 [Aphanomyces astaci]
MIQSASSSTGLPRPRATRRSILGGIPAIQMRDIRQLDEAYVESQEPTIVVRQQAILVNVGISTPHFGPFPIRAVVLRNACIVFDGPNNVVAVLQAKFREYSAENPTSPFEFSYVALQQPSTSI